MKTLAVAFLALAVISAFWGSSSSLSLKGSADDRAGVLGYEEVGPADNFTCPADGVYPDEDCQLFIQCWSDVAILYRCIDERPQLFDLRYNGCEWAENVDCGDRYRDPSMPPTVTPPEPTTSSTTPDPTAPTQTTTQAPNGTFTCPSDGVFPHDEKCEYYWSCFSGTATLTHCQLDYLYDLRYDGCNFPEYVDCGDRERPPGAPPTVTPPDGTTTTVTTTVDPTATTGPTTPPPNGTFTCPTDGLFPHEEKCEYYWNCFSGTATLTHCELDYLYDLRYNGCNFPQYVDCGERERPPGAPPTVTPPESSTTPATTGPTDPTAPTTTAGPEFQCPEPEGTFPDPVDCTKFYVCLANTPIHESCPDGLYFNPATGMCDWPSEVDCEMRTKK